MCGYDCHQRFFSLMARIKLTVLRLYQLQNERMIACHAEARIFAGEYLVATEQIQGFTESPVSKIIHHSYPATLPLRVEWQCEGIADIQVSAYDPCHCCDKDDA